MRWSRVLAIGVVAMAGLALAAWWLPARAPVGYRTVRLVGDVTAAPTSMPVIWDPPLALERHATTSRGRT